MSGLLDRRSLLAGAAGLPLLSALPAQAADEPILTDVELGDDELLEAFIKMRYSLDDRVTIGWVDAVNYGFAEGDTFPLYRLLAATWYRVVPSDSGPRRVSAIEIAFFLDFETGKVLDKLTMPITGKTVDVPLYRAGPSRNEVVARQDLTRDFSMKQETREGQSFFVSGRAVTQAFLSQPQRRGDEFLLRQDLNTRVYTGERKTPGFFYREWTVTKASWSALKDPLLALVPSELAYSATTAWRPWMQMGDVPGQTIQNGLGSRTDNFAALPAQLQRLARQHHPDLVADPAAALAEDA